MFAGDTDGLGTGRGNGGSGALSVGGSAVVRAVDKVIERGRRIAAHLLEAAYEDVAFRDGRFAVAGTDRGVTLSSVAKAAYQPRQLPAGMEPGFDERAAFTPPAVTFPNGCQVCEVEIDPATGAVRVVRHTVVDDVGRMVNPMLVKGQIHGGIVQGLGQGLFEDLVYDRDTGQLLSGSFMDYAMPRADDMPFFDVDSHEVPTQVNPLGAKGVGEAGTVGALPALLNAVNDALAPLGVRHLDMPLTPERVWRAIRDARGPPDHRVKDQPSHRRRTMTTTTGSSHVYVGGARVQAGDARRGLSPGRRRRPVGAARQGTARGGQCPRHHRAPGQPGHRLSGHEPRPVPQHRSRRALGAARLRRGRGDLVDPGAPAATRAGSTRGRRPSASTGPTTAATPGAGCPAWPSPSACGWSFSAA